MKIGIFGLGQMGSAMIRGYLRANTLSPANVLVKGGRSQTAKKVSDSLGLTLINNLTELAEASLILIATTTQPVS
ncbi:NAD(P)-binding domain-containing protein [Enterococcus viikkiensis]|uniref:NAD(P)-binding domain-containing protein n=1 Tax=Enterococcus viikkiensis TaxID=930854 RepID=UPI003F8F87E1